MRNSFIAIAIISVCGSASATYCADGSKIESHPNGDCNYKEPVKTVSPSLTVSDNSSADAAAQAKAKAQSAAKANSNADSSSSVGDVSNKQKQKQQQQQQQKQAQSLKNANTAGGATVSISGNESGSGDRSSFTAWAPIIPAPAAPAIASANLVVIPGVCGPRVRVITTQVIGQHYGPAGGQYDVQRGYTETVGPYLDENGNPAAPFVYRNGYLMGHIVTQAWATLGTSSAAGFSIGGFVDSKGLQGGANASGAVQQLVKGLQVMDCVMPTVQVAPLPAPKPRPRPVRRVVAPVPCAATVMQCTITK